MAPKFYKNDYKIQKDLKDFANTNPIGRALKPYLKWVYLLVNPYLPYPRDFLVRMKNGRDFVGCDLAQDYAEADARIKTSCKRDL
jgi:hypothetical protein